MDERVLAGAVVQRVRPAAIRADGARERVTTHLVRVLLVWVDDRLGAELPGSDVVCADRVAGWITRGEVLDEVEEGSIRRDRVEAEVPLQRQAVPNAKAVRVDDQKVRLGLR